MLIMFFFCVVIFCFCWFSTGFSDQCLFYNKQNSNTKHVQVLSLMIISQCMAMYMLFINNYNKVLDLVSSSYLFIVFTAYIIHFTSIHAHFTSDKLHIASRDTVKKPSLGCFQFAVSDQQNQKCFSETLVSMLDNTYLLIYLLTQKNLLRDEKDVATSSQLSNYQPVSAQLCISCCSFAMFCPT